MILFPAKEFKVKSPVVAVIPVVKIPEVAVNPVVCIPVDVDNPPVTVRPLEFTVAIFDPLFCNNIVPFVPEVFIVTLPDVLPPVTNTAPVAPAERILKFEIPVIPVVKMPEVAVNPVVCIPFDADNVFVLIPLVVTVSPEVKIPDVVVSPVVCIPFDADNPPVIDTPVEVTDAIVVPLFCNRIVPELPEVFTVTAPATFPPVTLDFPLISLVIDIPVSFETNRYALPAPFAIRTSPIEFG